MCRENNNNKNPNDVDGNGVVNSKDLYDVIRYLQTNQSGYNEAYDVNKDGTVNSADLYVIIVYLQNN